MRKELKKIIYGYKEKFYRYYYKNLEKSVIAHEKERKKQLKKFFIHSLYIVISSIILASSLKFFLGREDLAAIFAILLIVYAISTLCCICIMYYDIHRKYIVNLKKSVIQSLIGSFTNLSYSSDTQIIKTSELRNSGLFSAFNKVTCDDSYSGKSNGVEISFADIKLSYEGHEKNEGFATCFKGVILKIKTNKYSNGYTLITPKTDYWTNNNRLGLIIGSPLTIFCLITFCIFIFFLFKYSTSYAFPFLMIAVIFFVANIIMLNSQNKEIQKKNRKLEKIELEDPQFNNMFRTYTDNQIDARFVLTTSFMDKLLNLKTAFGSNNIKCSFYKDNLIIAIRLPFWKNPFEIGNIFTPLDKPRTIYDNFLNEIISILIISDYFRLDEKTGL